MTVLSSVVQHNKILDVKLFQNYMSFSWRCDPMLRKFCSSTCDTIPFLVQEHTLIVLDPKFNVVEHRNEYDSSFGVTRFRGSQECVNFSHDLDRWVA